MNIIIYGKADGSCSGCTEIKRFLDSHKVSYVFNDISTPDAIKRIQYKKELMADKVSYIPYTKIDESRFVGFTDEIKKEISEILGIGIDE